MLEVMQYFDLMSKVVVITGGAGFLGVKHAEAIIEANGIPIVIDIDENSLHIASNYFEKNYPGKSISFYQADITKPDDILNVKRELVYKLHGIDVLINNAANNPTMKESNAQTFTSQRLENFPIEKWNQDINVGLTGAFLCSQIFGSVMAEQKKGVIINISSDLGIIAPDQRLYEISDKSEVEQPVKPVTYSVIKFGIIGLTKYLATYWADRNVRCNTVAFGGVFNEQSEEFLKRIKQRIPLGRMAFPDEYKASIIYLCADASSYMNGHTLVLDGGRTIW